MQLKFSVIELFKAFGLFWPPGLGEILPTLGSLLSIQDPGVEGIDWGDDAAALQITVLEAGTQGKCSIPAALARVGCSRTPMSRHKEK